MAGSPGVTFCNESAWRRRGASALMDTRADDQIAEEQAALRRVATLVADGAPPAEIFAAVAAAAGRLLGADVAGVARYDDRGATAYVARWSAQDKDPGKDTVPVPDDRSLSTLVLETGEPVRVDDISQASELAAELTRRYGIRSGVAAPISVEGQLWGVLTIASASKERLPGDAEARLAGFAELAATAIANAQARMDLRGYAEEQAALRRVATLVAGGAAPENVFAALAAEIGRLLGANLTTVARYEPGEILAVLGTWRSAGTVMPFTVGTRVALGGHNLSTLVFRTGRPARFDDYGRDATGAAAAIGRDWGYHAAVGVPVTVEGRLWGLMSVVSTREKRLPADTEARLAGFAELAGTAIAGAQARMDLRGYAEEQAALRRVATLVAGGAAPEEVFAAVNEEIGRVFAADFTGMNRYDTDGMATAVGLWSSTDTPWPITIGDRLELGGRNVTTLVHQTGRPARIANYDGSSGAFAEVGRDRGYRAAVGVPVTVEGRLWGVATVASAGAEEPPPDTETRLAGFTELVGTAIANADARAALAASRARIVTAADEARRRIERDLHDGAQQRLVTLVLRLREAQAAASSGTSGLSSRLAELASGLEAALEELREIARGIHPAVLTEGGLRPALGALARRCPLPVDLRVQVPGRLPGPVETAAYYVVSEALTNTARHARATAAHVQVTARDMTLRVSVRDNGYGGADADRGSGLTGLKDRVEALGGRLTLHSPPGEGTTLHVLIPLSQVPSPREQEPPPVREDRI
jgi:signal transduction histidine kinase